MLLPVLLFVTGLIYKYILTPLNVQYLQTIVFILVIAALVQLVEMFLKKSIPSLYQALGVYLPLITTKCAVLGVALNNVTKSYTILQGGKWIGDIHIEILYCDRYYGRNP